MRGAGIRFNSVTRLGAIEVKHFYSLGPPRKQTVRHCYARTVVYCGSMDKRLAKRHKRQVARAKLHSKTSEPDVRTDEQIEAAREASRPDAGRGPLAKFTRAAPFRSSPAPRKAPKRRFTLRPQDRG